MRALFLTSVVASGLLIVDSVRAQSDATISRLPTTSCPTVLPVAEGERSIVVPTQAPQFASAPSPVPHIATQTSGRQSDASQSLLRQKLAERDRLQREISELRTLTKSPSGILVRVQMLEVNLTRLRQLGVDLAPFQCGQPTAPANAISGLVDMLTQSNLGRVLAEPTLVVTDGRPSSLCVGGEFPTTSPDAQRAEFRKYGTQLDLLAVSLGNNRVRLEVRPRVSELDPSRAIKVGDNEVPGLSVRECDLAREMEFGTTAVVSGISQIRTESIRTAAGSREQDVEIALLVVVTPEIAR